MAEATVKTVQYIDPRIEPQPDPLYKYVIGPTQNQYYKIAASSIGDRTITFNNLTTLGVDRAYLDTFEIEVSAIIDFKIAHAAASTNVTTPCPAPTDWTFDSFPLNKCCEEVRVNINGGAFFSQPMSYLRAKERYMDQWALARSYQNVCPTNKPYLQTESGRTYDNTASANNGTVGTATAIADIGKVPTRLGRASIGNLPGPLGMEGSVNNSIIRLGEGSAPASLPAGLDPNDGPFSGSANYFYNTAADSEKNYHTYVKVTWREPLFCSPFSSRYDATYGRPLYNITSMDINLQMQDLGNMIRVAQFTNPQGSNIPYVDSYKIKLLSANLCYQVMTIPPNVNKPLTTLVPYRRFVPFVTNFPSAVPNNGQLMTTEVVSGTYTLNEIPTAIWAFFGPETARLQHNEADNCGATDADNANAHGNWASNKVFGYIDHVNISLANTTQILNTADVRDLYRIAKANGCEDPYWSWAAYDMCAPYANPPKRNYYGCGSVLRMIPGVDLIIPDQPLIPGANANNMVFQIRAKGYIPPHSPAQTKYALWLLFEYVGVAAISPGQCEVTMNPLGSGEIMAVSPIFSATSEGTEGKLDGAGVWDAIMKNTRIREATDKVRDRIASILRRSADAVAVKRPRPAGGAVIGGTMKDWTC